MLSFLFTQTPLRFLIQSFWRDEAFTYLLAKKNILDIIVLTLKDFNPPLYYILLHFWMKIAGQSEISLRILSLIFFWATIYVTYLFLVNILKINTRKSILYLSFFVLNPLLNYYAFEARMYTLFAFFTTLSFYFFIRKQYKPYILISILGLYTHYFMLFVVFTQFIYVLYEKNEQKIKSSLKSFLIMFIFFIPVFISFISQKQSSQAFWITKPSLLTLFNIPFIIFSGYESDFNFYKISLTLFSLLILIIIFLGIFYAKKHHEHHKNDLVILLLWSFFAPIIIFIISLYKPIFLPRYLIFSTPGLILLLIYLFEKYENRKLKSILLILFLFLTLSYNHLQIIKRNKADFKKVISEIKSIAHKDDPLYVKSELDFHTAEYYFDASRVFIYGKNYDEIPRYVGKVLIPKNKLVYSLPLYPRRAFVLKSDLSYDIQSEN